MAEPEPDAVSGATQLPAWRRWSGAAVVGILAVTLVVQSLDRDTPRNDPKPAVATSTAPASVASTSSTVVATVGEEDVIVFAARSALSAWGEFAATGDISKLMGTFDPDGLQFAQLAIEAEGLAAAPVDEPYLVVLENPEASVSGTEATVSGNVTFANGVSEDQMFQWDLYMLEVDGVWLLTAVSPSE